MKTYPLLNKTQCHADVGGGWRYSFIHS